MVSEQRSTCYVGPQLALCSDCMQKFGLAEDITTAQFMTSIMKSLIFHSMSKARCGPPNILTKSSILSMSGFTLIFHNDLLFIVSLSQQSLNQEEGVGVTPTVVGGAAAFFALLLVDLVVVAVYYENDIRVSPLSSLSSPNSITSACGGIAENVDAYECILHAGNNYP